MGYKAPPMTCLKTVLSIKRVFLFHDLHPQFFPPGLFFLNVFKPYINKYLGEKVSFMH